MPLPKFQVFPGADGLFYWRLRAGNGEIVAHSEGYFSRDNARRGVATVIALVVAIPHPPIEDTEG